MQKGFLQYFWSISESVMDQNKSTAYISSRLIRQMNKQLHNMMQSNRSKKCNGSNDNWSQLAFLEASTSRINLEPSINEGS